MVFGVNRQTQGIFWSNCRDTVFRQPLLADSGKGAVFIHRIERRLPLFLVAVSLEDLRQHKVRPASRIDLDVPPEAAFGFRKSLRFGVFFDQFLILVKLL